MTEQHERNHHSGSDHAGKDREKECAAFPRPWLDYRLVDRRRSNGRRRRLQERTVDRVCLRRRIRAELLREKLPALLVHAKRLGAVSRDDVCLHQTAVSSLAKRRERDQFLGPLCRLPRGARTQARIGKDAQGALADVGEVASLPLDPRSVFTGQEWPARQRLRQLSRRPRLVEFACGERFFRVLCAARGCEQVDPRPLGQIEAVAAERICERDPVFCDQAAELARDYGQRFLPGRGRRFPPDRVRELVRGNRPASGCDQVDKEKPTLTPREATLAQHVSVRLGCDPTGEKHLQPQ